MFKWDHTPSRLLNWGDDWKPPLGDHAPNYVFHEFDPAHPLFWGHILFPELIEIHDCVLLKDRYSLENFQSWRKSTSDLSAIEDVLNHTHVWDLFYKKNARMIDSDWYRIAEMIRVCWELNLQKQFPERKFELYLTNTDQDYGPTVGFFSKR